MTDYKDLRPTQVQELPERPLRVGAAVQHDGTTETAMAIVAFLENEGIGAYMSPRISTSRPAVVKIERVLDTLSLRVRNDLVWPWDYVLIEPDKTVSIIPRDEFNERFVTSGGLFVPLYKTYDPTENKENN